MSIYLQSLSAKSWEPVYGPFDSLTIKCERDMDNFARSEKCKVYVKSMYAIAKKTQEQTRADVALNVLGCILDVEIF